MNACSVEIIALIFDFACNDTNGETARRLGLVCKYFREIAEPLELRALSISGFAQLRQTSARLAHAIAHPRKIRIEHLFICDYTEKHALWTDTLDKNHEGPPLSRAQTSEGCLVSSRYKDRNQEFWSLTERVVFLASSTLKTLYLISFCTSSYKRCNPAEFVYEDGVLVALRGKDFPCLRTLVLKHVPEIDNTLSARTDRRWKYPTAPLLEKFHLISHCRIQVRQYDSYADYHPLLIGMHKWHPRLRHLVVTSSEFQDVRALLRAICKLEGHRGPWTSMTGITEEGDAERALVEDCLKRRVLPGNLESVEVCIGRNFAKTGLRGTEGVIYRSRVTGFQNSVKQHSMKGLSVVPPTPAFPEKGKREYEILLSEWMDHVDKLQPCIKFNSNHPGIVA